MNLDTHLPTELLRPFIKAYLIIESREEFVNRVLPDTSLVMAFRYKGHISYQTNDTTKALPASVVSGLRKSGRLMIYAKDTGNILVLFKESGAQAFMKEPMYELFEESAALDNLTGYRNLSSIEDQLAEASNHTQRIDLIEQFLLSKLYNHKPDPLILAAMERIHAAKGSLRTDYWTFSFPRLIPCHFDGGEISFLYDQKRFLLRRNDKCPAIRPPNKEFGQCPLYKPGCF